MRGDFTSAGFFQCSSPWAFVYAMVASTAVFLPLTISLAHAQTGQDVTSPMYVAEQISSGIKVEHFDDWVLRCVDAEGTSDDKTAKLASCEIYQPLIVNNNGTMVEVLNLAVSRANDKAGKANWALIVLTWLDVHLASDFGFGIGNRQPKRIRYRNCNQSGCFVVIPLDNDHIDQLKKAAEGNAFFRLLNGQTVKMSFSLKGFTKAFNALSEGRIPSSETDAESASITTRPNKKESRN